MKKVIITLSLIGSGLIILDSINVVETLTMLLLAGSVPGTSIILSPSQMLIAYGLILGFIVSRFWLFAYRKIASFIRPKQA